MISKEEYDAVLFDLDGVITDTAGLHAKCWKFMFDEFLKQWSEAQGVAFRPFDIESEYKRYVDGKLRNDGVRSFLEVRGIHLPLGDPEDPPGRNTIHGLGNRKNALFNAMVESGGVTIYDGGVRLVRHLIGQGIKTAIVSSSKNCRMVLESVGILELFDVRVDGIVAARLSLRGKPAPDTFLKATELLGVRPARSVVIEDAVSGVQAGRNGGFGLVVGVDRQGGLGRELKENGAHRVVQDPAELLPP